jgi:hypothetical protein
MMLDERMLQSSVGAGDVERMGGGACAAHMHQL